MGAGGMPLACCGELKLVFPCGGGGKSFCFTSLRKWSQKSLWNCFIWQFSSGEGGKLLTEHPAFCFSQPTVNSSGLYFYPSCLYLYTLS